MQGLKKIPARIGVTSQRLELNAFRKTLVSGERAFRQRWTSASFPEAFCPGRRHGHKRDGRRPNQTHYAQRNIMIRREMDPRHPVGAVRFACPCQFSGRTRQSTRAIRGKRSRTPCQNFSLRTISHSIAKAPLCDRLQCGTYRALFRPVHVSTNQKPIKQRPSILPSILKRQFDQFFYSSYSIWPHCKPGLARRVRHQIRTGPNSSIFDQ